MRYMRGDRGKRVDMRYDLKGRTQGRRDGMQTWSRNVRTKDGVIQTRWMRDKNRDGHLAGMDERRKLLLFCDGGYNKHQVPVVQSCKGLTLVQN